MRQVRNGSGGRGLSWRQGLRWMVALPMVIAALCVTGMLSTPAEAVGNKQITTIRSALMMYESDHGRFPRLRSSVASETTAQFEDTATANQYLMQGSNNDGGFGSSGSATASESGIEIGQSVVRSSIAGEFSRSVFAVDFGITGDPLEYNIAGVFGSSSSNSTPGFFLVELMNVDTGVPLFSRSSGFPTGGSSASIGQGGPPGLHGFLLPDVTYRLTVVSELSAPDGDDDASVSAGASVSFSIVQAPEPGTLGVIGVGGALLLIRKRKG